jgi:hypothetical protein
VPEHPAPAPIDLRNRLKNHRLFKPWAVHEGWVLTHPTRRGPPTARSAPRRGPPTVRSPRRGAPPPRHTRHLAPHAARFGAAGAYLSRQAIPAAMYMASRPRVHARRVDVHRSPPPGVGEDGGVRASRIAFEPQRREATRLARRCTCPEVGVYSGAGCHLTA